jgi:hypothetical protein
MFFTSGKPARSIWRWRVHVRVIRLDVFQHINGSDGELPAEVAADAEGLDDLKLPAPLARAWLGIELRR